MLKHIYFLFVFIVCSLAIREKGEPCGENVTWTLVEKTLTISGTGEMMNYSDYSSAPWSSPYYSFFSVVIEEGVTSIGNYAFSNLQYFHINISSTVTIIGDHAFCYSELDTITISSNIVSIGEGAFQSCSNIKSIYIPSSVTSIGAGAFSQCQSLASIEVEDSNPNYVTVDGVLFSKDASLLIQYPPGCKNGTYIVPSTVKTIGKYALSASYLTNVTILDGVTSIEGYAFYYDPIRSITIPSSVLSIGEQAFGNCPLESIVIPSSVKSLGDGPFASCTKLTTIEVESDNKYFKSIDSVLFDHDVTVIIQYPVGNKSDSYCIPKTVTKIGGHAFEFSSLSTVDIPSGVVFFGNYSFHSCLKLNGVSLPNDVWYIGDYAFSDSNLQSIHLPGKLKCLGSGAFSQTHIRSVEIASSVTSVGEKVFSSSSLESVAVACKIIGNEMFSSCSRLKLVAIDSGVESIGNGAFSYCQYLTGIDIPNTVKSIGDSAFLNCDLEKVSIPSSVEFIGQRAFDLSPSLNSLEVDSDNQFYKSIDGVLFDYNVTRLIKYPTARESNNYIIPSTVTTIDGFALSYSIISDVTIPSSVRSIGKSAFQSSKIHSAIIPYGVLSIEEYTFFECEDLQKLVIPDSVTFIGESAFGFTLALKDVTIPDCVETIGSAFEYSGVEKVFYQGSKDFKEIVFESCKDLDTVCVSPDYNSSIFCGLNVTADDPYCQQFYTMFNHCFKGSFFDNKFVSEERRSVIEWKKQSNNCLEYVCINETGPTSWSECNSSGDASRLCMNDDVCEENWETKMKGCWIEIVFNDNVSYEGINMSGVAANISKITSERIVFEMETDDQGYILRGVIPMRDDTETATVANELKEIQNQPDCEYGILCEMKNIISHFSDSSSRSSLSSGSTTSSTSHHSSVSQSSSVHDRKRLMIVMFLIQFSFFLFIH